jgi:hypothetical protein
MRTVEEREIAPELSIQNITDISSYLSFAWMTGPHPGIHDFRDTGEEENFEYLSN